MEECVGAGGGSREGTAATHSERKDEPASCGEVGPCVSAFRFGVVQGSTSEGMPLSEEPGALATTERKAVEGGVTALP